MTRVTRDPVYSSEGQTLAGAAQIVCFTET